jgi:large subunit ribosomal protein L21
MYAVITSGGKQYRVVEGQTLKLEKLEVDLGAEVKFEQVLMLGNDDKIHVGAPFVDKALVVASVVSHGRHDKIKIIKFRRRKHHRKHMGHRQYYTEVKITAITA